MAFNETIRVLRQGKASLRSVRQRASIEEKLKDLWRGQHIYVQIVGSRRALQPWERPWDIMSDVRDSILIKDGTIESLNEPTVVSRSSSQWVRPRRPWILNP
jgi:hypothetical protein